MTQTNRVIFGMRCAAFAVAAILVSACDGGPATTANADPIGSGATPVTGAADPSPVTSPATSGAATLAWIAPDQNTDGSTLTDLVGYRIYYGVGADALTEVINVPTVGVTTYVVDNLPAGTYYFSIRAYTSAGIESDLSNVVSDTIG